MDIYNLIPQSITQQATAVKDLQVAVESFKRGGLERGLKAVLTTPDNYQTRGQSRATGEWNSTDYGSAIANGTYRPKLKFLFKIEFLFYPEVLQKFQATTKDWVRTFTFNVKTADRPKVDMEFEEINQYNFRTKVLKMIKHRELTMTFTDDVGNSVHEFFRFMLMAHSPVTRRSATSELDIGSVHAENTPNGMLFDDDAFSTQDSAHRGAVDTNFGNVIKVIKLTQMFINPTEDLDHSPKEVAFFFLNPRVVSFDLDDVSHESSDPNTLTMSFDYDSIVMTGVKTMGNEDSSKKLPPWGSAVGDVSITGNAGTNAGGNSKDPYSGVPIGTEITGSQSSSVENLLRNTIINPGMNLISKGPERLVDSLRNSNLGRISNGLVTTLNQSMARPSKSIVTDLNTAGEDTATYVQAGSSYGTE